MRRRDILVGAGAVAAGTSLGLTRPSIAQGKRRLAMITDWPEGPGMLTSARRLARTIAEASDGRIEIDVSPSGAIVRPFETFEAVEAGVADMFHSHIGYFEQKSPALHFFSGVPFGLTTGELFAWVHFGGGQALYDQLGARFAIKPLICCSPGAQMGGWFVNEVRSKEDFRGLRYRMAGLGAEVYRRLGATAVLLPAAEIVPSLQSGAIDACEWIGPWLDTEMGLHSVASHYYYPGWHEPGAAITLGIAAPIWDSFPASDQRLIATAAASEFHLSLAEFSTNNAAALKRLRAEGTVTLRKFDDALLKAFAEISRQVVVEAGSGDGLSAEILASYLAFRESIRKWTEVNEGAQLGLSGLPI